MVRVSTCVFEGDKLVKLEYDVKLVKSDVNRNFIVLKLNGEEVIVEKFTEDEWREWKEREKKESLHSLFVWIGTISFYKENWDPRRKDYSKIVAKHRALAVYRLLWYLGQTSSCYDNINESCAFQVKYKGYVFEIGDNIKSNGFQIHSVHLIPKKEPLTAETEKKYEPSKEVRAEIVAIFEYLTKYPVEVFMDSGSILI